jgi:hypothetical protein
MTVIPRVTELPENVTLTFLLLAALLTISGLMIAISRERDLRERLEHRDFYHAWSLRKALGRRKPK